MSLLRKKKEQKKRRTLRVRGRLRTFSGTPRACVHRSLKHFYAQIIDDMAHRTVLSCSTLQLQNLSGDKKARAKAVGAEVAKLAREKGIEKVFLDRGPFLYHGRVQAFTEGLREGGLKV